MQLSDYPCESLSFSGLGAAGETAAAAGAALAEALDNWVASHAGQRILQVTPVAIPVTDGASIAALIVHTAGSELGGELAEQVAAAVEDAMETSAIDLVTVEEANGAVRGPGAGDS
jgi:ABC-type thiamine transport system substrate-binding protein